MLVNEDMPSGIGGEEDGQAEEGIEGDEGEEGREVRGQKPVYKPSQAEWEAHMRTHIPFRKWCPYCVRGKCKGNPHMTTHKSKEDEETPYLVFSVGSSNTRRVRVSRVLTYKMFSSTFQGPELSIAKMMII